MLTRKGKVMHFGGADRDTGEPARFFPIAESFEDAKRLAEWTGDRDVRPAEIGSAQGETLGAQILASVGQGCTATYCVDDWNDDGSPRWRVIHEMQG